MILPLLDDLAGVVAATGPDQYHLMTPCDGFDVQRLRQHLTGGLAYFDAALDAPGAEERGREPHSYAGPDELATMIPQLSATLRSALRAGIETTTVNVPHLGGAFPGAIVLDMLLIEVITHGWDLAIATGQRWEPDDAATERALTFYRATIRPEWRGPGMAFGHETPGAPDAPAMDRIAALAGRDPSWSPVSGSQT